MSEFTGKLPGLTCITCELTYREFTVEIHLCVASNQGAASSAAMERSERLQLLEQLLDRSVGERTTR